MFRAVLFDIDGTLVDSVDLHAAAWREAFHEFGKEETHERLRSQIGKGGDQLLPEFFSKSELDRFGELLEERRGELFKEKYMKHIKAFSMTRELFEKVRARGLKIALASSAKGDELKHYERVADIVGLVEEKTSKDDAHKSKPHPDIFEAALAKLDGIEAKDAIVVGDTPYDVEAAKRAGIASIGVLCGGVREAELIKAGALAVYRGPSELFYKLDESPILLGR